MKRITRGKDITPSFPALRDDLIPATVRGEAPKATAFSVTLPGIDWRQIPAGEPRARSRRADERYARYMRSEQWRINRQPALDRARGCCERCTRKGALEVHHLTYERFTRELPEDLQALCTECHLKADAERAAAWQEQLTRWAAEAAQAYEEAGFEGWLRKVKGLEPDEVGDDVESLCEEYDEWRRDRDEADRE